MPVSRYPSTEERRRRFFRLMEGRKTTFVGRVLWTEDEIRILHALSPNYAAIQQALKGRTVEAIWHKCRKLGITKRIHIWTGAEILKLRRLYPTASREAILAEFPFATWSSIKHAVHHNGLHRPRALIKRSKDALMNVVLERCAAIGWTLVDLDEECGTGTYFQQRHWRDRKPNPKALLKAIEVLGGKVSVTWDD